MEPPVSMFCVNFNKSHDLELTTLWTLGLSMRLKGVLRFKIELVTKILRGKKARVAYLGKS